MKSPVEDKQDNKQMVDEIADEVVETIFRSKLLADSHRPMVDAGSRNVEEISKLRNRVTNLERRMELEIEKFKIYTAEIDKAVDEKSPDSDKVEKRIADLGNQVDLLRAGMIRLSNEVRRIRESLLRENLLK